MSNKQEMSKGLRDKLYKFFSFSYTHFTLMDFLREVYNNDLYDRENENDTATLEDLWAAHDALAYAMRETFGKYRMTKIEQDNDAKGDIA